jgi:predicted kinase
VLVATTLRRRLVAEGLPVDLVSASTTCVARGREPRPPQDYSAPAVRQAGRRCDALAGFGAGYVADATHLRRRDRRVHVLTAAKTGLAATAVLTPLLPLDVLVERNARRSSDEAAPDVLVRQAHRRSLISTETLLEEGFSAVHEL